MVKGRIFISIETTQEVREALKRRAGAEGKTVTEVLSRMINEYLNTPVDEPQSTNVISLQQKVEEMQQVLEEHAQLLKQHQQCLGELSA
jgi:regulator of PEP synthase PpsR (kinase-PPPase family)